MSVDTKVQIRTTRFGTLETVEAAAEALLDFPEGLPGFERHTSFALLDDERYQPFRWLQSTDDPYVGFLLLEPAHFVADYEFDISDQDAQALRLTPENQGQTFCILVVRDDLRDATANLKAPILINWACRLGRQVILTDERFSLRHPISGGRLEPAQPEPTRERAPC